MIETGCDSLAMSFSIDRFPHGQRIGEFVEADRSDLFGKII